MRLAISTKETLTDMKTDLVVANNNNNVLYIYHSEHYGLSFLDLTDVILFTVSLFFVCISIFASTLCMCVMYLTSI